MIFAFCLLALALGEPASAGADTCGLADHRCQASHFLRRAREATTARDRALYLFGAHRSYLASFDRSLADADLCAARRALERSLAVKHQPPAQRASFAAKRADLTRREGARGERCKPAAKREPQRIDAATPAAEANPAAKLEPSSSASTRAEPVAPASHPPTDDREPAAPARAGEADLLPMFKTPPAARPGLDRTGQAGPTPLPPAPSRAPTSAPERRGRALAIAGGATLGVGLALSGAAAYSGGRMLDVWRESRALRDEVGGIGPEDVAARDAALVGEYQRLRPPTLALALVGGGAVVVGAVLIGVGARRLTRAAARAALLPTPGGVLFHARF